jgi:hypothetical protein
MIMMALKDHQDLPRRAATSTARSGNAVRAGKDAIATGITAILVKRPVQRGIRREAQG